MEMLIDGVCIRTYINYKQTRLKILIRGTPSMNAQEISDNNIARSISLASQEEEEEEEEKVLCVLV